MAVRFLRGVKFSGGTIRFKEDSFIVQQEPVNFTKVFGSVEFSLNPYTDITNNIKFPTTEKFPTDSFFVSGSINLLGYTSKFSNIEFYVKHTIAQTSSNEPVKFSYFNGSDWNVLFTQSLNTFNNGPRTFNIGFTPPTDWQPTVINGHKQYWLSFGTTNNFFDGVTIVTQSYAAKITAFSGVPLENTTYTTVVFDGGLTSWVKPEGVTEVIVECWGGGGSGGGAGVSNSAGGGGAGGQYARKTITYPSAAQVISYSVATFVFGTTGAGVTGQDTTWDTNVVVAKGGAGGSAGVSGGQAAGGVGTTTGGVGDVVRAGGSGEFGTTSGAAPTVASGNGGSGASFFFNGYTLPIDNAGSNPSVFDYGGSPAIGLSATGVGNAGGQYGGGGAGGFRQGGGAQEGGEGQGGLIIIHYR